MLDNLSRRGSFKLQLTNVAVAAAPVKLFSNNPNRFAVALSNAGALAAFVGVDNTITASNGLTLVNTVLPWLLLREQVGLLVTGELWAISTGAGTTIGVLEVLEEGS